MILETPRLILRHYQHSDKGELLKICSDIVVMNFVFNGVVSIQEFDKFIGKYFAPPDNPIGLGTLLIKVTNEIIGFAGLHLIEEFKNTDIEFGFVLGKENWRKGFASEIGKAQIEFGKNLGYSKVLATVHPDNFPSINLLKRLGLEELKRTKIERGERIIFTTTN